MALRRKSSGEAAPQAGKGPTRGGGKGAPRASGEGRGGAGRLVQLRMVYRVTRQRDPKVLRWSLVGLVPPLAIGVLVGLLVGPAWLWIPFGLLLGVLLAVNVFARRVQRSAYAEMEGKPGAAAGIVERMRGDWRVTPAVQVNRNQDVVHRVVGRPGVVLIAEGRGRGPRELLANEVRRVRRVVGDTPVHDIVIGGGEGEVSLQKLQVTLVRMGPRVLKGRDIDAVERRLRAVGGPTLPVPKGPLPRNVPRGGKIR